jgi:hypothetical protein
MRISDHRNQCEDIAHTFSYYWPWLRYRGKGRNSSLLVRCWLLNTAKESNLPDRQNRVLQSRRFAFGPLVRVPLFSWRYHQCSFIWEHGLHNSVKFNENRSEKNGHFVFWSPAGRASIFGHPSVIDKLFEITIANRTGASKADIHTAIQTAHQKPPFSFSGDLETC